LLQGDGLVIRHINEEVRLSPDAPSVVCQAVTRGDA
jgi:hypothetical protein